MDIKNAQERVDAWIQTHGVRYFNELTNMAQLTEEVAPLHTQRAESASAGSTRQRTAPGTCSP